MNGSTSEAKGRGRERPPRLLAPWVNLYRSVPKVRAPLSDLDVSFTAVSASVLIGVRLALERALLAAGWPAGSKMTKDAAASLTSAGHALLLVPGAGACLSCGAVPCVPSARMDGAPRWWRDAVAALLQLCTGYMIFDSLFLYVDGVALGQEWTDFEWLVLGHHVATILYMTSCRVVGAGHISAMILMFAGECTNPLMNSMFVTRFAVKIFDNPIVHDLHACVEFLYALSYALVRIVVGPLCGIHLTYDLLLTKRGRENVPIPVGVVWMALCWAIIFGTVPWMQEAVDMLRDGLAVKYNADYDYGERYRLGDEL